MNILDKQIIEQIQEAMVLGINYDYDFFELREIDATHQFNQWKRLSRYIPHLMEEGYDRVSSQKIKVELVYNLINENLAICLTSNDPYLRTFAELIGNDQNQRTSM